MNKNNIGSNFDDFLEEEALLDEAIVVAVKRVIAWQIAEEMKAQKLNGFLQKECRKKYLICRKNAERTQRITNYEIKV